MKMLHVVAIILVIVGGLNWGLIGLLGLNLVSSLLGAGSALEKLVYILVGLSAAYIALTHKNDCKGCC